MFRNIALLFVVLLVIYVVLPDADLVPGAKQWMSAETPPVADEDNLFNALAGLTVAADENMAVSGARQIAAANNTLARFIASKEHLESGSKPDFDDFWNNPVLVPGEGVLILCDPRAQDCRDIWPSQKEAIQQLLAENEILLNRYRELHNYQEYRNTLAIDVRSPLPDFSALMSINRLHVAAIVTRFINGETAAALADLNADISFLRRLIRQANTLIVKMVALSMLKHDLYVYASLMDIRPDETYMFNEIPVLSEIESSLDEPVRYEFLMNANLAREIKQYPELITGEHGLPAWLPFPLYKANHSINLIYEALNHYLESSRLPPAEFYRQFPDVADNEELKPGWFSYVYNPIGCILFTLSLPDLSKYIIRIHDMNGLIHMVNLKRAIRRENLKPEQIEEFVKQVRDRYFNPYTGEHIDWNPGEQTLSFNSPGSEYATSKLVIDFSEPAKEKE